MNERLNFLPIKVVVPRAEHVKRSEGGGSEPKVFGDVLTVTREALISQIEAAELSLLRRFREAPNSPAVLKVRLKEDALAKTHRPVDIFSPETCPIIGMGSIGELYVSATTNGISRLKSSVLNRDTKKAIANLSTIEEISAYSSEDAIDPALALVGADERYFEGVRLRLFNHRNPNLEGTLLSALVEYVARYDLEEPEPLYYAPGLRVFRVHLNRERDASAWSEFIGTQSLRPFPHFEGIALQSRPLRDSSIDDVPQPAKDEDYPVLGLIDSGTDLSSSLLRPWRVRRQDFVAPASQDPSHGTFVAGLIINARKLNHDDRRFPAGQCKIVDVCAIPRKGSEKLSEPELIQLLETAFLDNPDVRIWNLSLGTNVPCHVDHFSEFAAALDDLQRRYDRVVILAAGNHNAALLRPWPPNGYSGDEICVPADSVRSLVVGSIAHRSLTSSGVREDEPSPFSRRGPGPVFLPKPDLSHYGGNCTLRGDEMQVGIVSLGLREKIAEASGTSYATPLVASIAAQLAHVLAKRPSSNLIKALLIHSAAITSNVANFDGLHYFGFGTPRSVSEIVTCTSSAITWIFEPRLVTGYQYEILNFPIPECLRDEEGNVRANVTMTLTYDSPLDADAGPEYVQTNVDASLGFYGANKDGKMVHTIQIPLQPNDEVQVYERDLVEHGFKWSPSKVYHRTLQRAGAAKTWRLVLSCLHRSGFAAAEPQNIALIITMSDPDGVKPVYRDAVAAARANGLLTEDLLVRNQIRLFT